MLKIRLTQGETLKQQQRLSFELRVLRHLQKCFPEDCRSLGEQKVREIIRLGIARARSYGIATEQQVCQFIDVMFALGLDFDQDSKFPWAPQTLSDNSLTPRAKMTSLCKQVEEELKRLAGRS